MVWLQRSKISENKLH